MSLINPLPVPGSGMLVGVLTTTDCLLATLTPPPAPQGDPLGRATP